MTAKTADDWVHAYRIMYQCMEQDDLLYNARQIKKAVKNAHKLDASVAAHDTFRLTAMKSLMSFETIDKFLNEPWYKRFFRERFCK